MSPTVILSDTARELDSREADGLEIALVWYPAENAIAVRVFDSKTGERHEIPGRRSRRTRRLRAPLRLPSTRRALELPLAA